MRFHILGLPHTKTNQDYTACAYTAKVYKFGQMMTSRGHQVFHYGHPDSTLACTEHTDVISKATYDRVYGAHDYKSKFFTYNTQDEAYQEFYARAILAIGARKQKYDFILPFWGAGHRPICDAHPDLITVEPGIGYAGGHWARWKVFESYAILHAYYGLEGVGSCTSDYYNRVIPNYFDPEDFAFAPETKKDYLLYLGRVYSGKGIDIAIELAQATGCELVIAGQGTLEEAGYRGLPGNIHHMGYADRETRRRLMSEARASIIASKYVEPFGGVQVENLFSGTPTITSDIGAFAENNPHGVTGFRCNTFDDFCTAWENIDLIDPAECRDFAMRGFSLEAVAPRYESYFQDVLNVYTGEGWYQRK